jgi:hypothetical protein
VRDFKMHARMHGVDAVIIRGPNLARRSGQEKKNTK